MLVAFSVTPLGTGEAVGEVVAEAVRVVRDSGLPNQTDAMFTTIEGDWDETMAWSSGRWTPSRPGRRGSAWCSRRTSGRA